MPLSPVLIAVISIETLDIGHPLLFVFMFMQWLDYTYDIKYKQSLTQFFSLISIVAEVA